jgi:hypothetical protein
MQRESGRHPEKIDYKIRYPSNKRVRSKERNTTAGNTRLICGNGDDEGNDDHDDHDDDDDV